MITFSIIGAMIGAGFASGQEIYLFFYRYGKKGIIGLTICSIILGTTIYKTFKILLNNKIENYKEFLDIILNQKNPKNKYMNISYIVNIIINAFLLLTFYIMISGFGAYFMQEFKIYHIIGSSILAIICFIIFLGNIKGIVKINKIVVPILIGFILIIGIKNIGQTNLQEIGTNITIQKGWLLQSIIYASYNLILLVPVLINLKNYLKNKKQILTISVVSTIIICTLALCIYLLLVNIKIDLHLMQMPAVYIIGEKFQNLKIIYGIIILLSIFTTAISVGISFLENISKNEKSFPQKAAIMCISSILISNIGFSKLVKILFPTFGYLGLVQIYFILKTQTTEKTINKLTEKYTTNDRKILKQYKNNGIIKLYTTKETRKGSDFNETIQKKNNR